MRTRLGFGCRFCRGCGLFLPPVATLLLLQCGLRTLLPPSLWFSSFLHLFVIQEPGDEHCHPCTEGFVCLGGTSSSQPTSAARDGGYQCPVVRGWGVEGLWHACVLRGWESVRLLPCVLPKSTQQGQHAARTGHGCVWHFSVLARATTAPPGLHWRSRALPAPMARQLALGEVAAPCVRLAPSR